jgi:hypothetical protein
MNKYLFNIILLVVFFATGVFFVREVKTSNSFLLEKYDKPSSFYNLFVNSVQSWKYGTDSINNSYILTYPDTSKNEYLYNLTQTSTLVFRFSGNMCSPCIEFVISRIDVYIQDFRTNDRVLFLYSDASPFLSENYYTKRSFLISDIFHEHLDELNLPYLCILDKDHKIHSIYIPDINFPELLDKYLEIVSDKLNVNEMQQQKLIEHALQ